MTDATRPLTELQEQFLGSSTQSMPVAGMSFWAIVGIVALFLKPGLVAYVVLFGSGMIFPLAVLIDRATGRRRIQRASTANPLLQLFLRSIVMIVLLWPLPIIAARLAGDPTLIVLGGAILMGVIWIPYGWAAADPNGLQHAVGRALGCYAAYLLAPAPYRATAISAVVLLAYGYSLLRMRRPVA